MVGSDLTKADVEELVKEAQEKLEAFERSIGTYSIAELKRLREILNELGEREVRKYIEARK